VGIEILRSDRLLLIKERGRAQERKHLEVQD